MKKLRQSKTFWINLLIVAAAMVTAAMETGVLTPQLIAYLTAAVGGINILLRIISNKSIKGV